MNKVAITADGTCDLPSRLVKEKNINLIQFNIQTDAGTFQDSIEISEKNVFEYMADGVHKAHSIAPTTSEYKRYFTKMLDSNNEIVHISMGSKISEALEHASLARAQLGIDGQRIHIYDTGQLSSGIGFFVLEALKLQEQGLSAKEIISCINQLDREVYTSFITKDADFLYYNGRVSRFVMELSQRFNIHPVLHVVNGEMKLKKIMVGNYEGACKRYIKSLVKKNENIDWSMAFFTYAGVSLSLINTIDNTVKEYISFENFMKQPACATISVNCGPGSFGIIFRNKI